MKLDALYCFRWLLTVSLYLTCADISNAQLSLTTSDVLSGAFTTKNLPFQESLNFIENEAGRIPIVETMEFRTETNEFVYDQQEYLIRFDLNSSEERKAYDRVMATNKQLYNYKQEEYLGDRIEEIYKDLVDYYFYQEELSILVDNLSILRDKKIVLAKLLSTSDEINVNSWLSIQNDIMSAMADSVQLTQSLRNIESIVNDTSTSAKNSLNFDDMISISSLQEVVDNYILTDNSSIPMKIAAVEESMAKAEFELEEAETNKWLQWVQVRYQADNDVAFQKELAFSTSINLPNKSTNRAKKNEAALDVWDSKYEKTLQNDKYNREFASIKLKLESAIIQYENLNDMINGQALDQTYQTYLKVQSISPLVLLDIKTNINKNRFKLLDEKKEIYEVYLDLLSVTSLYVTSPKRNYISENLNELK